MRKQTVFSLLTLLVVFTTAKVGMPEVNSNKSGSQNLQSYVGKYPSDLLKAVPDLKTRMKAILGEKYKTFDDRWVVQSPISKVGETLLLQGCMAHNCGMEEAAMAISLTDGKLSFAIMSQNLDHQFSIQVFSEDKSPVPDSLKGAIETFKKGSN
jgi:hypothetical protein